MGELSAGRTAFEGASLTLGNETTRRALVDESRRPLEPRERHRGRGSLLTTTPSHRTFGSHGEEQQLGPSGMTAYHLRPLLESEHDTMRFWRFAQDLARACAPDEVVNAIRLGRLTALQKPNGVVRGIVVGDIIRLVARTIAQQLSSTVEQATAPFQCALSTKAGGECIAHALQALISILPRTTVLSVDGVGAFDLIS